MRRKKEEMEAKIWRYVGKMEQRNSVKVRWRTREREGGGRRN